MVYGITGKGVVVSMKPINPSVTGRTKFKFDQDTPREITLYAEWSDTLDYGFAFRIRHQDLSSLWQWSYQSFAHLRLENGREFILMSAYWDGTFKPESIYEIKLGVMIDHVERI